MADTLAQQNPDRQGGVCTGASTFLITWVCYGTWLPGRAGAVPRTQNAFGAPLPEADTRLEQCSRRRMPQQPYRLDAIRRQIVLRSLLDVCSCRGWTLWAVHVRTNHVHIVVTVSCKPEQAMATMKAYSSRALNQCGLDTPDRDRWARHGSTQYLWTADAVERAIQYVVREQGECMAVFEAPCSPP
ncbi:MAG: transposase [Bryobacteraceae bacterium]